MFKHRFKIVGCDLFVYRYMTANPDKFPRDVIDNVRNYHMREGNLKQDLEVTYLEFIPSFVILVYIGPFFLH